MSKLIKEKLNDSVFIQKLRENNTKYSNIKESRQILSIFQENAFVWHDASSHILTMKIDKSEDGKVLTLSNPPVFDVDCMLFNQTGSLLAISGKNGVMVFEVPWRYGKFTALGTDRNTHIGRSWNIAEQFFACSNRIQVIQVAWHPGSASSTHLTVLSSDNYIRIYDVTDPPTPQQVISLQPTSKSSYLSSDAKISFSTCFGESAVSFDFGPPEKVMVQKPSDSRLVKLHEEVNVWPLYLLHGNGDVYIVKAPLKKDRFQPPAKIVGPLPMFPPSEDNYGFDSCFILCLHTAPTCIVIATVSGIVYHCIVLGNSTAAVLEPEESNFAPGFEECDMALYVFESVELPLSLTEESDDAFNHPMKLYKDMTSLYKYHCAHVAGIHSVAVPFLQGIAKCLENDGEMEKLLTDDLKQMCVVEHVLCTKPLAQMDSVPVLGLDIVLSDGGVIMVCLLASWEFVCLPLVSSYFSSEPSLLSESASALGDRDSSVPKFKQHIEKVLQRSLCCPYMKSSLPEGLPDSSPQQWFDLLCSATQRLREDYVQKHYTAQSLLHGRAKLLAQQKKFQLQDLQKSLEERQKLTINAEHLAERYEEATARHQDFIKRLAIVLQKIQKNLPYLSKAELDMKQTLLNYEEKLHLFEASLSQIKKKLKHQESRIKRSDEEESDSKSVINLTEMQIKHVKELLMQEGGSISELKDKVISLKKQPGM